jgi:uncharacterized protein (TIGR00369 family)
MKYFGLTVPMLELIGLVPGELGEGKASSRLALRHEITNSRGEIQGGALMTALDFTLVAAARSKYPGIAGLTTVDMNTSFLSPATSDLTLEARCVKAGRSLAFCEGEVRDAKGELVARATGTFKIFRATPR